MDYKLSILIPTLPSREAMFEELTKELSKQILLCQGVEVLSNNDLTLTIGAKRNELLNRAKGEYVAFIDDDDKISSTYIKDVLQALESKPDCLSLRGVITWDGLSPEIFEHSIKYSSYVTHTNPVNGIKYERYPNHLNVIHSEIAKSFKFPEINFGEDSDWAKQIHESGLIKKEVYIDKVLYHYLYKTNK